LCAGIEDPCRRLFSTVGYKILPIEMPSDDRDLKSKRGSKKDGHKEDKKLGLRQRSTEVLTTRKLSTDQVFDEDVRSKRSTAVPALAAPGESGEPQIQAESRTKKRRHSAALDGSSESSEGQLGMDKAATMQSISSPKNASILKFSDGLDGAGKAGAKNQNPKTLNQFEKK